MVSRLERIYTLSYSSLFLILSIDYAKCCTCLLQAVFHVDIHQESLDPPLKVVSLPCHKTPCRIPAYLSTSWSHCSKDPSTAAAEEGKKGKQAASGDQFYSISFFWFFPMRASTCLLHRNAAARILATTPGTKCINRMLLHTMSCVSSPRSNAAATSGLRRHVRPTSRWGSFERLVPASFAPVDVSQLPRNEIPANIKKPSYADTRGGSDWDSGEISFVQSDDLPAFERACKLAAEILQQGGKLCQVLLGDLVVSPNDIKISFSKQEGVTTEHIDKVLHDAIISRNAYPSPLNYMGFPKSVCTSVNNVIAHGIPDE